MERPYSATDYGITFCRFVVLPRVGGHTSFRVTHTTLDKMYDSFASTTRISSVLISRGSALKTFVVSVKYRHFLDDHLSNKRTYIVKLYSVVMHEFSFLQSAVYIASQKLSRQSHLFFTVTYAFLILNY